MTTCRSPATAALVLWVMSLVDADLFPVGSRRRALPLPYRGRRQRGRRGGWVPARTVTAAGAISGAMIGITIATTPAGQGWALLVATFLAAAVTPHGSACGGRSLLGIAEERGGRRGFGNAVANTGFACAAAMLSLSSRTAPPRSAFTPRSPPEAATRSRARSAKPGARRTYLVSTLRQWSPARRARCRSKARRREWPARSARRHRRRIRLVPWTASSPSLPAQRWDRLSRASSAQPSKVRVS